MGDHPTSAFETWRAGPWDHDGAPHRAPWDDHPDRVSVSTVWADAERATPAAFEDHDGCRAPAIEPLSGPLVRYQAMLAEARLARRPAGQWRISPDMQTGFRRILGVQVKVDDRLPPSSIILEDAPHQVSDRRGDWWQDDCVCPCHSCDEQGDHWVGHCTAAPGAPRPT